MAGRCDRNRGDRGCVDAGAAGSVVASEAGEDAAAGPPAESAQLPAQVRLRVVAFAAQRLSELAATDVPEALRRVSRFTPSKRARLAGVALGAAVDIDPVFRNSVAEGVRAALPDLAAALAAGSPVDAADPFDVAAVAYLLRTPGWQQLVSVAAAAAEAAANSTASRDTADQLARLAGELDEARNATRAERAAHRAQLATAMAELDSVRRSMRQGSEAQRRSEQARQAAEAERDEARAAAEKAATKSSTELRRLRARIYELEAQAEHARKAGRGTRSTDDIRLWLLLDSVTNAAAGLRRELALPPPGGRPADEVAASLATQQQPVAPAALGLAREDPGWLDALLAVPGTHLLVDGYNVTKTGFPGVPLEAQRGRLVAGLAALAARTAAEVTVVFDGAERTAPLAAPSGRGVRVLFSPAGRTADDVLAQLVWAEPTGRPIAVVSADREVVARIERAGARGVPPVALLGLLGRA